MTTERHGGSLRSTTMFSHIPGTPGAVDDVQHSTSTPDVASLKVLFLASRDWYNPKTTGGDNTLWENARFLAWAGHSVTFLASSYRRAPRSELIDGINVVRIGPLHTLWLTTLIYYLAWCRGKYDVVVTEGFGGSRIPRLAPLYVREPIITEWHQIHRDLFAAQYPRLMQGALNLLERVTAWVHRDTLLRAGTDDWRERFPAIGFRPENIWVVPVSIRDEWLHQSNGTHRAPQPTMLWIGKFRRYKCPDHIIRAMPAIFERFPACRLVLMGRHDDRSYERELSVLARALGVSSNVEFRFNVTENEKLQLIHAASVLVVPSAVEGFGIVVLEANACGVPVVASSRVPPGAVQAGVNGLRYEFGDVAQLGAALIDLFDSPARHRTLSDGARVFAQQFGWTAVGSRFEELVMHAASKPKA